MRPDVAAARPRWCAVALLVAAIAAGCGSGVDVCDRYFEQYGRCFDKMGPAAGAAMRGNLERERQELRRLAKTADGRAQMVKQCSASLEAIRATCR
jgi:hypothetical protein